MNDSLAGLNVLVVEDEPLIALDIAMSIEGYGGGVIGPARTVAGALSEIDAQQREGSAIDAAVLDVNLGSETCEPVAIRLRDLGIPFILHTGNSVPDSGFIADLRVPVVEKPARHNDILAALIGVIGKTGD